MALTFESLASAEAERRSAAMQNSQRPSSDHPSERVLLASSLSCSGSPRSPQPAGPRTPLLPEYHSVPLSSANFSDSAQQCVIYRPAQVRRRGSLKAMIAATLMVYFPRMSPLPFPPMILRFVETRPTVLSPHLEARVLSLAVRETVAWKETTDRGPRPWR